MPKTAVGFGQRMAGVDNARHTGPITASSCGSEEGEGLIPTEIAAEEKAGKKRNLMAELTAGFDALAQRGAGKRTLRSQSVFVKRAAKKFRTRVD